MTKHLNEKDVRAIADYTRIKLADSEIKQAMVDLNKIIDNLGSITAYDLEGVEPTFHPIGNLSNVMREDVPRKSFDQKEALENAPYQKEGSFLIPSILGGGEA